MDYNKATRRMLLDRSGNRCEICKVRNDIGPYSDAKNGRRLYTAAGKSGPIVVCAECRDKQEVANMQMELFDA